MEPPRYDVWLVRFAPDAQAEAADGLQRAFGIEPIAAEAVLQDLPFLAKRGAEREQAERYAAALSAIGAEVKIKAVSQAPQARGPVAAVTAHAQPLAADVPAAVAAPALAQRQPQPQPRKPGMPTSAKLVLGGIALVSLLMIVAFVFFVRFAQRVAEDPYALLEATGTNVGEDLEPYRIEQDLAHSEEAREFLYADDCRVWSEGIGRDALDSWIDRLYAAGAPQVSFAGIERIGSLRVSALLVAELPSEDARRARVLEVWNEMAASYEEEQTAKDQGQQHVYLFLD